MELSYINPTKSLIVCHLDAGEELGTLNGGEHGVTEYIRVDGSDPNYQVLLEQDPLLENVVDPGAPRMPPPAEGVAPADQPAYRSEPRKADFADTEGKPQPQGQPAAKPPGSHVDESKRQPGMTDKPQPQPDPKHTPHVPLLKPGAVPQRPMQQQPTGRPQSQPPRQEPPKR